jgi:hypothetical protein
MGVIFYNLDGTKICEWPDRTDLVLILCDRIKIKLANSTDQMFRAVFENVDILPKITIFDPDDKRGGRHIAENIYISRKSVLNDTQKDGDIMGTLFHEFHHYLNYKYKFRPYRYRDDDEAAGIIFDHNADFGTKMQSEEEFKDDAYQSMRAEKMN